MKSAILIKQRYLKEKKGFHQVRQNEGRENRLSFRVSTIRRWILRKGGKEITSGPVALLTYANYSVLDGGPPR